MLFVAVAAFFVPPRKGSRSPLSKTDEIERDIGDLIQISHRTPPSIHIVPNDDHPLPKGPRPDVEHKEGVNQVGKLTAEAVVREYDAAVKEIEALGAELTEAAKKCEAMVAGKTIAISVA